jgi:hypothetical protein
VPTGNIEHNTTDASPLPALANLSLSWLLILPVLKSCAVAVETTDSVSASANHREDAVNHIAEQRKGNFYCMAGVYSL